VFSGCLEHSSAISQIIREAKVNNKDPTVIWLDLANDYGSILHKMIDEALNHYYIPEHIQGIINGYLMACSFDSQLERRQRHGRG